MPIEFACDSCSKLLRVPDGSGGAQCECPACHAIVDIPDPNAIGLVEVAKERSSEPTGRRIRIACPKCRASLRCDRSLLGTKGQCKNCNYIFLISDDSNAHNDLANHSPSQVFECPTCGQLFEGTEEMQGRRGKCHACGEVFEIQLRSQNAISNEELLRNSSATADTIIAESDTLTEAPHPPSVQNPSFQNETFQVACPSCNGIMAVPISGIGKQTACPYCQQLLQIPDTRPSPLPSPGTVRPAADSKSKRTPKLSSRSGPPTSQTAARVNPTEARRREASPKAADNALTSSPPSNSTFDDPLLTFDDPLLNPFQPNSPGEANLGEANLHGGSWEPHVAAQRGGVSFSSVFRLALDRAFPNCLIGALAYGVTIGAATLILYGSIFVTGLLLKAIQIEDPTIITITLAAVTILAAVAAIGLGTLGFCVLCHGALTSIRSRKGQSSAMFSTGGVFGPMLIYMFAISITAGLVGAVPQVLIHLLGESFALVAAGIGLVLSLGYAILALALCLTPFAILDGEPPLQAMTTSLSLFQRHTLTFLTSVLCGFLIYAGISMATCGIGALLLVGFPFFVMAALYHLATR
ncbi:MAG: hypothetical protein NXI32_16865 [bacterium]|nr:hypothetical protein [bacterium]